MFYFFGFVGSVFHEERPKRPRASAVASQASDTSRELRRKIWSGGELSAVS
jgi:hypothetical protein